MNLGNRHRHVVLGLVLAVAAVFLGGGAGLAQDASVPLENGLSVVAGGLVNPRGFLVGDDGGLIVALAGTGGSRLGTNSVPDGPLYGGATASITVVTEGCASPLAERLPSAVGMTGRILGVADVAVLGDQLYALIAGGGRVHGNPRTPNGLYRVAGDGSVELVADLGAWVRANPVALRNPLEYDSEGIPTAMAAIDGEIWVVESGGGQVIRIAADGTIGRVLDLSPTRDVPAGITPAPTGGAYISTLGPPPHARGTAKVLLVAANGAVTDAWAGRTAAVDVAVASDGSLLALELATRTSVAPPFFVESTGRLVRQTGPDRAEVVVRRIDRPIALDVASDGTIYIAVPTAGTILRIEPDVDDSILVPRGPWDVPPCDDE